MARPSKYKKAYCKQLIDCAKKGRSFRYFCGSIGISRSTGYNWLEKYPEFQEAYDISVEAAYCFWEEHVIDMCLGKAQKDANATMTIMVMCNKFGWRRKDLEEKEDKTIKIEFGYKPKKPKTKK